MASDMDTIETRMLDGDVFGAIEQLEAAVDNGDRAAAERLVELRHRAFASLDKAPGRPEWPPVYADPFPGETGIPTVDRTAKDAASLGAELIGGSVTHHGCLRIDNFIDHDTVTELTAIIDGAFDSRSRRIDGNEPGSDFPAWVPFEVGAEKAEKFGGNVFVRVCDVPAAMRKLTGIFEATGLRDSIATYFAETPAMIANKWILRRSPSGVPAPDFHQDGAFLGAGIRTIDCWIALSDCGPGTGRPAMDLVPRRFDLLETGQGAHFSWSLSEKTVEDAMPDAPVVSPVFRAGDALMFDELLPHRTTPGPDLDRRYAVESWFVAPSSYPDIHVPFVI